MKIYVNVYCVGNKKTYQQMSCIGSFDSVYEH